MLAGKVESTKGRLDTGKDADFCVLEEAEHGQLHLCQVWKFGVKVVDTDAQ